MHARVMGKNYEKKERRVCKRCVMDSTDADIVFDENGICNHCKTFFEKKKRFVFEGEEGKARLKAIVDKILARGRFKDYDCVLGVSGGTDSSYVALLAHKLGLRLLLVHLDNGWNTKLTESNIKKIVEHTGFDFERHAVDPKEFRDLQLAFFKASVVDIEMVTDHAIRATVYKVANEKGIRYVLRGTNIVTEAIMPEAWRHRKQDLPNLKGIHKRFGSVKLKTYPTMGLIKMLYYRYFKGIRFLSPLNYVDYNREEAKKTLHKEFGWEDYGRKHNESVFTKFYQSYILPTKFGIDKRKPHLSNLVCSGQITREEALKRLEKPLYPKDELERDKKYVLEKLGLSEEEFQDLMRLPKKKHEEYGSDEWLYSLLRRLKR